MPRRGRTRVATTKISQPRSESEDLDSADDMALTDGADNSTASENDENDSEGEGSGGRSNKRKTKSRGGSQKKPSAASKASKALAGANNANVVELSLHEMVHNALLYFLLMQHKKYPVKRSEIVNQAMNRQRKSLPEVIAKLDQVFSDIFGLRVVGLEEATSQRTKTCSSYTLISKFTLSMIELVTDRPVEVQCKRSYLFMILTLIFMSAKPIEEDHIWTMLQSMGFDDIICKKREDLTRFIKTEYVSTMYLHSEETAGNDRNVIRYSWGPRAEIEFSKYAVLKFAARQFPGKKPSDFAPQYLKALERERDVIEAEEADAAANHSADPEDGSHRSTTNRNSSSREMISDLTEDDEEPGDGDIDIETDED